MGILTKHDNKDHIMVAFTAHSLEGVQERAIHGQTDRGIFLRHAYTLISVVHVLDKEGKDHCFVLLRNPHGCMEWTGAWSDTSQEWQQYPDIAKELNKRWPNRVDEGFFFMEGKDFLEIFDGIDVVEHNLQLEKVDARPTK